MEYLIFTIVIVTNTIVINATKKYYIILPSNYKVDTITQKGYHELIRLNRIDSCHSNYILLSYSETYHNETYNKGYSGFIPNYFAKVEPIVVSRNELKNSMVRKLKYIYPLEVTFDRSDLINHSIELYIIKEEEWNDNNIDSLHVYSCCLCNRSIIE